MIEKIKKVLLENPTLSNREIGKIVGLSRNSVQYYLNKLNIHRDRKEQQKLNNTSREKILKISETAEQIIIGSILGDGYISPNRHPIDTSLTLNSELRINHGYKNGKGFVLCTDNFTIKEVKLLRKILKHNFNLDTTIQKSNIGNPRIYIRVSCREHFISLISNYICKSMQYKLMF